jgi:hypothetical protein
MNKFLQKLLKVASKTYADFRIKILNLLAF